MRFEKTTKVLLSWRGLPWVPSGERA